MTNKKFWSIADAYEINGKIKGIDVDNLIEEVVKANKRGRKTFSSLLSESIADLELFEYEGINSKIARKSFFNSCKKRIAKLSKKMYLDELKEKHPDLKYDETILESGKENSFWYGRTFLSFAMTHNNEKYLVEFSAIGDCEGTIFPVKEGVICFDESERFKDRSNNGIRQQLLEMGINKDEDFIEIFDIESFKSEKNYDLKKCKAIIQVEYGNWFELTITKDGEMYGLDVFDDVSLDDIWDIEDVVKDILDEQN